MHDSSPERLRSSLRATADDLTLDRVDPSAVLGRATKRRNRRRLALAGGTTVVAVAIVGAVVANRDQGDDTLELANPTDTTQPADDGTTADTAPATSVPITTPPTLPPAANDAGSAVEAADSASAISDVAHLLPWQDGFLRIGFEYTPQPLGPLPDEVTALFPDEVTALFPDGLPPTIEEAFEALSEAGLLDEVTAVLEEHPEAAESIYAVDPPPPTLEASFTTDGNEWTTVDLTSPTFFPGQFTVSGERLITWSTDPTEPPDPIDSRSDGPRELTVAWTEDLVNWQSSTVQLDTEPASSEHVNAEVFVSSLAVVGDRWLANVERHEWIDYEALLPADVRNEIAFGANGYGISTDDDGIEIDVYDESDDGADEGPRTTYEFTWAELGLDGNPEIGPGENGPNTSFVTGVFGGGHEEIPAPDGHDFGTVHATDDQFILLGMDVRSSPDGRTWTPVPGLPDDRHYQSLVMLPDGNLYVGDGRDGPTAFLQTADGSVSEVALPQLPERYGLWNQNNSSAWIVEIGEPFAEDWTPVTVTIEHDGYVLAMTDGPDGSSYVLTDAATGAVVRSETLLPEDAVTDIWQFDEATNEAAIVITDDDGSELLRVPEDVFDPAFQEAYEASEPPAQAMEEWTPDLWLIATADAVNWLTVDLDDPTPEGGFWPHATAVNNGSVLYQTADGWTLQALPTGS